MSGLVGPGTEIYYWPPLGRPHVYVNLNVPQVLSEDVPLSSSCMLFYGLLDVDSQAKQTQLLCMHSCSCEINQIILKMTAPRVS